MDNSSNALIMAGSILLFVLALSVSVFFYSRILDTNGKILTTSESYDKTAEKFKLYDFNSNEKLFTGAEIANQILEITRSPNSATSDDPSRKKYDFKYYSIQVDTITFTRGVDRLTFYNSTLSRELNTIANPRRLYEKYYEDNTTNGVVVKYRFVRNKNV